MNRALHTLSIFGFAAVAVLGISNIHPWPAAFGLLVVLLLVCITLQALRDDAVAAEAARATRELFTAPGR